GARSPPLTELLALDDRAFRARFAGTPVKRTGRDRLVRNALIAAGNSGDRGLLPAVERLLADPSPLVRAMAVWALHQLAEPGAWAAARNRYMLHEWDGSVQAEWGVEGRETP
ncbi:MAG: HEAT repeat domain-containing protein, partial [Hyphomicrobiaceae bacterium]|nr:HEAT repeat domain-containing protein [Hyphomicrobiaceae bacterium]